MSFILVIDAGTTAFKAALLDQRMEIVSLANCEFEVLHPEPNRSELNAQDYWLSCASAVRQVVKAGSVAGGDIAAIAVTAHTDTLFALDAPGEPVANAIFWTDPRAQKQAERIQEQIGLERLFHTTGQTGASYVHFASRLAWFIENNAKLCKDVRYFLQTQDYIIYRLSGERAMDQSIACCSLMSYLEKKEYWQEILDIVGVDAEKLSRIIEPGEVAGKLTDAAAEAIGLSSGIPVVAAAMDQPAAAVALGNVEPGVVTEITGSALVIATTSDMPRFDEEIQVPCFYHAVPDKFLLLPWCETAGAALKWYRDQFFKETRYEGNLYDLITSEAAEVTAGSGGVTLLPHFAGSGSPEFNPNAKAVIYGLTIAHERKHISRAFLESIAFMLKQNLDILAKMDVKMDRIISSGGGSKSPLWCQIKADVTGLPVQVAEVTEATAKGAAILAVGALGWPKDKFVLAAGESTVYKPQPEEHKKYQKAYERFIKLNDLLGPLFVGEDVEEK